MKKILILGAVVVLAMGLIVGCSGGGNGGAGTPSGGDSAFIGYSDTDDHGFGIAEVTLENGKIVKVVLNEVTEMGVDKDYANYGYEPGVKAHQELPARFVEANSAQVEVYSGATQSSHKFIQAVERALVKAGVESAPGTTYFDGTFLGVSEADDRGYAVAIVTIDNDEIVDVELKEVTGEGEWKDYATYEYEPGVEAHEQMAPRFVEANSADVDVYSGATHSSEKFIAAVENALEKAKTK